MATSDKVDSDFIGRSLSSKASVGVIKGVWFGSVLALSQSVGSAWLSLGAEAKAAKQAMDMTALKGRTLQNAKTFFPGIVGTMVVFNLLRDSFEKSDGYGSWSAYFKTTAVVAAPTVGYAAMYRASPPAAMRFGLYGTILLHLYDRVYKPRQPFYEHMPLNRRMF